MPGSVPVTATKALTNATLPYVMKVAGSGWHEALRTDPALAQGLHTHDGQLLHAGSAEAHGLELDRKSTRLNSSHVAISYAVFCLKKKRDMRSGRVWERHRAGGGGATRNLVRRIH